MPNQITHDPTRGWLLIPEDISWPEKPKKYPCDVECCGSSTGCAKYENDIKATLPHLIDIAKEDWDAITQIIFWEGSQRLQDHHPYSVDAEFEVKRQFMETGCNPPSKWVDLMDGDSTSSCGGRYDYRKIARLVKAKEKQNNNMANFNIDNANDFETPTDSVTSDGTMNFDKGWVPEKPTESQDELWEIVAQSIITHVQVMPELKARFRIERI